MKDDIIGLRRLFIKDSATHKQKIEAVVENIQKVKQQRKVASGQEIFSEIAKQGDSLLETVEARSTQTSWMLVVIVGSVVVIGVLIWNRMRYYEKKHFI